MKIIKVLKNEYRDSLYLLRLSNDVSDWEGVKQAVVVSGTQNNRQILEQVGLLIDEALVASPDDLIIAVEIEEKEVAAEEILERLHARLQETGAPREVTSFSRLGQALTDVRNAQLVLISIPGEYATDLAKQSLQNGKHVFCFSHHVSVRDELELKQMARDRGVLMMGPDCGTAILDGYRLGFANVVRQGSIGLVSASGSGLQEVICLIHRAGAGISQAIGVGGRDLLTPVDGLMSEMAIHLLANDPGTQVIVVLAKASDASAQSRVLKALVAADKPFVVDFTLKEDHTWQVASERLAETYEECAKKAVRMAGQRWDFLETEPRAEAYYSDQLEDLDKSRKALRGLFSGGSLGGEASRILSQYGIETHSDLDLRMELQPAGHILVDLGAEKYTTGRAHPFIDPTLRKLLIEQAFADSRVGVLLMDVVIGWGSHPDPAGEIASALGNARRNHGSGPIVIAHVCGTPEDPQDFHSQRMKLKEQGVLVVDTNAQAAHLAAEFVRRLNEERV